MNSTHIPLVLPETAPEPFRLIVNDIRASLDASGFEFALTDCEPLSCGEHGGFKAVLSYLSDAGTAVVTLSYLKESELQAACAPDLSIGDRYQPARLARRIGYQVPGAFDAACRALQGSFFKNGTDEERLPASVTDCRLLFVRGNWHPQVNDLVQGVLADVRWTPAI